MSGFAPDVDYCFCSAVELCQMTADVEAFFRFYHPAPNVWFDALENEAKQARTWSWNFERAAVVEYEAWRSSARPVERMHCVMEGLLALPIATTAIADSAINRALDDLVFIGKKAERRIVSPTFLRRQMKRHPLLIEFRPLANRLLQRAEQDMSFGPSKVASLEAAFEHCNTQRARLRALFESDRLEAARQVRLQVHGSESRALKAEKKQASRYRRLMMRSFEMLSSVMGRETARMFVAGDRISIEGRTFDFIVKKHRTAGAIGHSALEIEIADKAGIVLSNLCLYFEGVPAMDQVVAIALHVASGDEDALLKTGNLFKTRPEAATHAQLVALQKERGREIIHVDEVLAEGSLRLAAERRIPKAVVEKVAEMRRAARPRAQRIALELVHPRLVRVFDASVGMAKKIGLGGRHAEV
jgi:hypothetical protein